MHKVKAWHCDYCKKILVNTTGMKHHEETCFHNPASKSCWTCEHLRTRPVPSSIPGVMRDAPCCALDKIADTDRTDRNPDGLKRGCEFHEVNKHLHQEGK